MKLFGERVLDVSDVSVLSVVRLKIRYNLKIRLVKKRGLSLSLLIYLFERVFFCLSAINRLKDDGQISELTIQ